MFRGRIGRLLMVAVGGGCLAVLIFVVLPMMDEPAPPATRDEIVAEVPGSDIPEDGERDQEVTGVRWRDGQAVTAGGRVERRPGRGRGVPCGGVGG